MCPQTYQATRIPSNERKPRDRCIMLQTCSEVIIVSGILTNSNFGAVSHERLSPCINEPRRVCITLRPLYDRAIERPSKQGQALSLIPAVTYGWATHSAICQGELGAAVATISIRWHLSLSLLFPRITHVYFTLVSHVARVFASVCGGEIYFRHFG